MKLDEIQMVGKPLVRVRAAEVDAVASSLWLTFPKGYREYMTRLGDGMLGSFVRIYPPWRIEKELAEWRRRVGKYWFWERGRELLPKERGAECVSIGDTINGDELVFHPTRPDKIFILPRGSDRVFDAGADLMSALEWICSSGELVEAFDDWNFEPFDSRAEERGEGSVADPQGESIDEIVELASHWAVRHSAKKLATKDMKSHVPRGSEAELLYEGIMIDGGFGIDTGYGIAWKITEKERGRDAGIFRWHMSEGSSGSVFEPAKGR